MGVGIYFCCVVRQFQKVINYINWGSVRIGIQTYTLLQIVSFMLEHAIPRIKNSITHAIKIRLATKNYNIETLNKDQFLGLS